MNKFNTIYESIINGLEDEPTFTCLNCNGVGESDEKCIACNGSGEGLHDGTKCPDCSGRGTNRGDCVECNGSGTVTPYCEKCDEVLTQDEYENTHDSKAECDKCKQGEEPNKESSFKDEVCNIEQFNMIREYIKMLSDNFGGIKSFKRQVGAKINCNSLENLMRAFESINTNYQNLVLINFNTPREYVILDLSTEAYSKDTIYGGTEGVLQLSRHNGYCIDTNDDFFLDQAVRVFFN